MLSGISSIALSCLTSYGVYFRTISHLSLWNSLRLISTTSPTPIQTYINKVSYSSLHFSTDVACPRYLVETIYLNSTASKHFLNLSVDISFLFQDQFSLYLCFMGSSSVVTSTSSGILWHLNKLLCVLKCVLSFEIIKRKESIRLYSLSKQMKSKLNTQIKKLTSRCQGNQHPNCHRAIGFISSRSDGAYSAPSDRLRSCWYEDQSWRYQHQRNFFTSLCYLTSMCVTVSCSFFLLSST